MFDIGCLLFVTLLPLTTMAILQTENLTKYYGKIKGIEDVNIAIEEGEVFGFIGPNGAGKSTLIRTLLSLIFPTSGRGTIFGKDIIKDAKEIKKDIGYLPGESNYYDSMTVLELMKYSANFYGIKLDDYFRKLVEIFELDVKRNMSDLSMGNKKKVAIVQSLLHRPRLLIMDEPTNGLDPLMQNRFFEVVRDINKNGSTVFFSSHILSDVQRLCKRVAVIKDGSIIAQEEVEQLRKKQLKHVQVFLENNVPQDQFVIAQMQDLKTPDALTYIFKYSGDINLLLNHLQQFNLKDILIEEPALEEVFMHYYLRND